MDNMTNYFVDMVGVDKANPTSLTGVQTTDTYYRRNEVFNGGASLLKDALKSHGTNYRFK